MNYFQTLDYLFNRLPMFTKQGVSAYKKDLSNIISLCNELGNPHQNTKFIHIGGTNGKGSTSHMVASVLQAAGYKTGLYTSPHLKDFRERIRINGVMIPESEVIRFVEKTKPLIPIIEPSFFELTLAMAFEFFKSQNTDIVVLEVGLGGRLDSTNIIDPEISLITNISLDHTNILGDNISIIASEKAGIIKSNKPVIIGESNAITDPIFIEKAKSTSSPITFADKTLRVANIKYDSNYLNVDIFKKKELLYSNLKLDLKGSYQTKNILNVISLVLNLRELGYSISDNALFQGLAHTTSTTGLRGRWQTLRELPKTICDTGHNEAGILEVLKNIQREDFAQLHMVIGMVKDKDVSKILSLLPKEATYYFCAPDLERALPATELQALAKSFNLYGSHFTSVVHALQNATENAHSDDLIFVGGSTFVVAEII
ncbi:MAG: bifunctional folylpolyglutamate synthase/dihydrofolate synthase [Pedobacter sp.]|nr:MAG: bifunctional folylpolyglutamate synthase/dihydrofolate synthase [Pedobacter sp.]